MKQKEGASKPDSQETESVCVCVCEGVWIAVNIGSVGCKNGL
jgi:hypothetical protein